MSHVVKVIYQKDVFVPIEPLTLPEDLEVEITLRRSVSVTPKIADVEQKTAILQQIVQWMQTNPLPVNAPHFTLEELLEH
jgi:predicted DNA-binding antitoxin AbrB/MazE fold protein